MKTFSLRRAACLLGYVSLLAATPALAQIGPIQPVLVMIDGKPENPHSRPDLDADYSVPMDVFVAANGSVSKAVVTESSGNNQADSIAAAYIRERRFLPALNERNQPVESLVRITVNMFKRGNKKVVRITLKPPSVQSESRRVKQLMCADFIWEVTRMQDDADVRDVSYEVMPFLAAHMYLGPKDVSNDVESKFWDVWPKTLRNVINRCEKAPEKMFFTEVLVPALDGLLPTRDTATASAKQ